MAELSLFKRKTLNKLGVPILTYYVKYTDLETGRIRTRSTGCRNRGDAKTARYYHANKESLKEKAKGLVI